MKFNKIILTLNITCLFSTLLLINCGESTTDSSRVTQVPQESLCGNTNEDCEGLELHGKSCLSLGFSGGVLACSDLCRLDTTGCTTTPVTATCNDGIQNLDEDGIDCGGECIDCEIVENYPLEAGKQLVFFYQQSFHESCPGSSNTTPTVVESTGTLCIQVDKVDNKISSDRESLIHARIKTDILFPFALNAEDIALADSYFNMTWANNGLLSFADAANPEIREITFETRSSPTPTFEGNGHGVPSFEKKLANFLFIDPRPSSANTGEGEWGGWIDSERDSTAGFMTNYFIQRFPLVEQGLSPDLSYALPQSYIFTDSEGPHNAYYFKANFREPGEDVFPPGLHTGNLLHSVEFIYYEENGILREFSEKVMRDPIPGQNISINMPLPCNTNALPLATFSIRPSPESWQSAGCSF